MNRVWQRLQFAAPVAVTAYSVVRVLAVAVALRRYGVNIWVFAIIELGTAPPYGFAAVRLARAAVCGDRTALARWLSVWTTCFLAPYAYLVASGHTAPVDDLYVVGIVMLLSLVAALSGMRRRVMVGRRRSEETA